MSAFLPRGAPALPNIAVQLDAPDEARGVDWPLRVNVPFAPGAAAAGTPLALRRGGSVLPTQVRPLLTWPDGSLRWVRLDAILGARDARVGAVEVIAAASPAPDSPLRIEESAKGIAVDTGAIAFEIPKARFAIAENLRVRRGGNGTIAAVGSSMIADGEVRLAAPPKVLRITHSGPVHGEIELRGDWGNDFEYLIRIAVDAGSPFVRLLHTFTKTGGRSETLVERISIDVPFAAAMEGSYVAGLAGGKPVAGEVEGETAHSFAQIDADHVEVDGEQRDGRLHGWFEVAGRKSAAGVAARWFWQEYPKAVSIGAAGLTIDLWSPRGGRPARIGMGAAKTHELVLWVASRGTVGKARAGAVATPLRGFVDPAYLARSGALPGAIDPGPTRFDEELLTATGRYLKRNARDTWDDCGQVRCDGSNPVLRSGAYGMLNWGDWNFPGVRDTVKGTDAWGNLEYDTTQVLALTQTATGNTEAFEAMVAAARHHMDVDIIHALPGQAEWVGMNHPKNPLHFSFELGSVDLGHTWTEGLLSYYLLTGDVRGLDAARGIADYLVRRLGDFTRGNPRQWGWPQIGLTAVYDVTGDQRYLDAARAYAERAMRAHPPSVDKGWKIGILADALAYTHARGGGAEIESWLRRYAALVVEQRPRDSRFYPALAYVGGVAAEPSWVEIADRRIATIDLGSWGKPLTIQGRVGLRILSLVQTQGRGAGGEGRGASASGRPPGEK